MYLIEQSPIADGKTTNSFFDVIGLNMFGIPKEWLSDSDRFEVWGTKFGEGNSDQCEFRFFKDNKLSHSKTVGGY